MEDSKNGSSNVPTIFNNELVYFNMNNEIIATDLYSGNIVWRNFYDQGGFSIMVVDSVLVIAQYIGADTYAYGLDPSTGDQL